MEGNYNSASRHKRLGAYLKNLRISKFVTKDLTVSDALEKIHGEISKLPIQGPRHQRSERHGMEYLREAVVGHPWARDACSPANTGEV